MSLATKIHLRENEQIVAVVRPYGLTSFWLYSIGLIFLGFTAFFTFWLFAHDWWGKTLFGLGMAAGLYVVFHTWFFNHYNYWVITSERVADINRLSWFEETISVVGYLEMRDIVIRRRGFFPTLFNYGLISIETRSGQSVVELDRVHVPQSIQTLIEEQVKLYRSHRHVSTNEAVFHNFLKLISTLPEAQLLLVEKKVQE